MEEIYTEKFSHATITLFRDYSKLTEKKTSLNSMHVNLDGFEDEEEFFDDSYTTNEKLLSSVLREPEPVKGRVVNFPTKNGKKKTHFFYENSDVVERFNLNFAIYEFDTINDRQIKRHYGNPFSEVTITTTERSVRKFGDKVTIKIYHGSKYRKFNSIYFKKSYHVFSVTINTKTGNFTILEKSKNGRNSNSKFRTNSFMMLNNTAISNYSFFNVAKNFKKKSRLYNEMINSFNDVEFTSKIHELLFGNKPKLFVNYTTNPNKFTTDLMSFFVEKKQIRIPDGDIEYLLSKFYPTEKYLKKNDRKLVASVLDTIGLKSKSTIKIVHKYPNIDLEGLHWLCNRLGDNYSKYLGNLNDDVLSRSSRTDTPYSYGGITKETLLHFSSQQRYIPLSDIEKENLIRVLSDDSTNRNILSGQSIRMYDDHFNMIDKIRKYIPDIFMKAKSMKEFNEEHRELSKILSGIRKGWVIEYQYDEKTLKDIEEPIQCLYDDKSLHTLYPVILKREEEYVEEGDFMHHCVASYADKDKSMIVSLRNEDGSDRVTVEYEIQNGKPIQKRHFCNKVPPETFNDGLLLLDDKIRLHARWGTLNWKEKKKVPVKINGMEINLDDRGPRQAEFRLPF